MQKTPIRQLCVRGGFAGLLLVVPLTAPAADTATARPGAAEAVEAEVELEPVVGVVEVVVEGIEGEHRAAVLAGLGIARYASRRTIGSARLERLLREAPAQAQTALEPFGYYRSTVNVRHSPLPDRRHRVVVTVALGEPVKVASVDLVVTGDAADDPNVAKAVSEFRPQVGDQLDHRVYEDGRAGIDRALVRRGFFDRKFTEHRVEVTRARSTAAVRLHVESGPRYRFGPTRFEDSQFPDTFMRRFVAWDAEGFFEQTSIETTQNRLAASGFFGGFEIEPMIDERADGIVPMRIGVVPSLPGVWTLGAFFDSGSGAGARVGHERRWLNDRGHSAGGSLELSRILLAANVEYRIPHPRSHRANWVLGTGWRNENSDIVDGSSWVVQGGLATSWRDWNGMVSINALYGSFRVGSLAPDQEDETALVVYPEITGSRVFARDRIRPREGFSLQVRARVADEALLSDVSMRQLRVEGRHVLPAGEGARLLSRLELGYTDTDEFTRLPPELRFFAGGQGSVRGYDWQLLGPLDDDGRPFGGPRVATFTLEYEREFRPSLSWAAFVDGGNVFFGDSVSPEYGVGVGVRWASPVGPVRFDIARGLEENLGGWKFYLSAGPDL